MISRTLFRLAARNTRRRRARTALTAGMVVAGVSLLMIALTWIEGLFGGMLEGATAVGGHVRAAAPEYAAREELLPLYANLPSVDSLAQAVRAQPGVRGAEPRIVSGVTVAVGEEIGDVFALAVGASERYFRERLGAKEKVASGRWFSGAEGELVLGARIAEEAKAKVGDEVVLLGMTQDGSLSPIKGTLVGIVKAGNVLDRQVLLPLERMQWMADLQGGATELLVFGERYTQSRDLARQLRGLDALKGLSVQSWDEREPLASMTKTVASVRFIIVFVVVLLASLGIWNTMTTSVLERTREVGVLRAMGLSRAGAVWLFAVEAVTIAVAGGLGGLLVGLGPSMALQHYGIRIGEETTAKLSLPISEVMHGRLTPSLCAGAFLLGVAMALLGSAPAALRAASIQPVTAMRSGR